MTNTAERGKAAIAAMLLLIAGAALGILADRVIIAPHQARAAQTPRLTMQEMARELDLSSADQLRMRALLDSIESEITAASTQGLDSLQRTASRAHNRIEAALPPDARPRFREWLASHHHEMTQRMQEMHRTMNAHPR